MSTNITSRKGMSNLIVAICREAAVDYLYGSKELSADAERFFRSKYFHTLTELDGNVIVRRLEEMKRREAI